MILYTVVPIEDVLEGMDTEPAVTSQVMLNGVLMEVEALGGAFEAKVVRVLSSNPDDYLASHHQPGFILRWK